MKYKINLDVNAIYNGSVKSDIDGKTIYIYDTAIICNNEYIDNIIFKVDNYTQFIREVKNFTLNYYRLNLGDVNTISINDICLSNKMY